MIGDGRLDAAYEHCRKLTATHGRSYYLGTQLLSRRQRSGVYALYGFARMVDDIVDTAGTLCAAAAALKKNGAEKVVAYCTHAVLSGAAIDNIEKSQLDEMVVTDTIPLSEAARNCSRIRQLSVAELLAETIRRIAFGESVSSLYVD